MFIDDQDVDAGATISLADASSATRIEPRMRERRIAVKRAAGRKRLRWAFVVVGVLALIVAVLAVLGSSLFSIKTVDVEGTVYADPAAVQKVVDELRGQPVLRVDTDAAERELEAIPWVEAARVSADFPSSASIQVRERVRWRRTAGRTGSSASSTARAASSTCSAAPRRPLEQVDRQQQREREQQHHQRHRRGAGVVVLLELGDDQERRDLGLHRHVAGDEDHRAVLADRAGEGQREPGEQRRRGRKDHPGERLPALRAEARGGLFQLDIELLEHRLHRAHHERQADEYQRHRDAEPGVGDLDAERLEVAADPAVRRVDRGQRDPATAVGSANGRSTIASTSRRPGNR